MSKSLRITLYIFTLISLYFIYILFQPPILDSADETRISFFPIETDQVLNNPYMGFVVDARYDVANQPHSLAHMNITWRALEPKKGIYAFDEIEAKHNFGLWKNKGVKLIIRVILDLPQSDSHMDIPDWLYESTQKQGTWYDMEYGKGFSPNYNNVILIQEHKRLIQALAERYNNDPQIAFVELGSIGHWGEWHTKTDEKTNIPFPERPITEQYVHHYIEAFSNKHLMMRRPQSIAKDYNMGLFNDAFGDKDQTVHEFLKWMTAGYTDWLTGEKQPAMPDFWIKAPSGGELLHKTKDFEDSRINDTIEQAQLTHVSWMGPQAPYTSPKDGRLQKNLDRFLKTIGYRFVIVSESHELRAIPGENLNVQLRINNRGVAPFYFQWPLELTLQDLNGNTLIATHSNSDIRTWVPGEHIANGTLRIPANLTPGNYQVTAAVIDPNTKKPGVFFANEGIDTNGRYVLGTVTIPSNETVAFNTEKIQLGNSLEQATTPKTIELYGKDLFHIAWYLNDTNLEDFVMSEDNIANYRSNGVLQTVTPAGERLIPPLSAEPSTQTNSTLLKQLGITIHSNELIIQKNLKTMRSYQVPLDRIINASTLQIDSNHNLYFHDDIKNWYSIDAAGQLRYILRSPILDLSCKSSLTGDVICLSPTVGLFGIRENVAQPRIYYNGQERFFSHAMKLIGGISYVPLRDIFELLDADVVWNNQTKAITINKENRIVLLALDTKKAKINNKEITLLAPPILINDTTFVPLRFVSEALDATVIWEGTVNTIRITGS